MRRILPAFVAALACSACTVPIFDSGMQAVVATYAHIPAIDASRLAVNPDTDKDGDKDFDLLNDTLTFFPVRVGGRLDTARGFVARRPEYDSKSQFWYQWWNGSSVSWLRTGAGYEEQTVPWSWAVSLKDGPSLGTVSFQGGDLETYVNKVDVDEGTGSWVWNPAYNTLVLSNIVKSQVVGIANTPVVVGVTICARSGSWDWFRALVRDGASYTEAHVELGSSGFTGSFTDLPFGKNYALPFLPPNPRHLVYAADYPNLRSFAQAWDGTSWKTWAWWAPPTTSNEQLANVTHRIDAVLAEDDLAPIAKSYLFSSEDQVGRVYRYEPFIENTLVAEFPLGALRFIGWACIDGTWRLLFSRTIVSGDQVQFEIRAIGRDELLAAFAP